MLLAFLILISSCTGPGKESVETGGVDFSYTIPNTLKNNVPFTINLDLINHMPRDVDLELCLQDTRPPSDTTIVGKECEMKSINAGAETDEGIEPNHDDLSFGPYTYYGLEDDEIISLILNMGYFIDRATFIEAICIFSPTTEEINSGHAEDLDTCLVYENSNLKDFTESENVPVVVDSIEKEVYSLGANSARLDLKFHLSKTKEGTVYDIGEEGDAGYVYVDIDLQGTNVNFDCGRFIENGRVKLVNGEREVSCYAEVPAMENSAYQENLNIKLSYYYKVTEPIEIAFEA